MIAAVFVDLLGFISVYDLRLGTEGTRRASGRMSLDTNGGFPEFHSGLFKGMNHHS